MASNNLEKTLNKMNLEELVDLRNDIDKLIKVHQKEKRKELQQQFKAMAAEAGFALDEVVPSASKSSSGKGEKKRHYPVKYINPENPSQTWTGLGLQPRWLRGEIEKGKELEDFRI
jgi:DNA-binding protein H-NS